VSLLGSLTDCGWRSRPRNVPLEVLRGNACLQRGGILYGGSDAQLAICQDLNDYYALGDTHVTGTGGAASRVVATGASSVGGSQSGLNGLATCGYGTHTDKCGERVVYVHDDAPGGCEQTCYNPVMERYIDNDWNAIHKFDYSTFCSDGGEGSRRVLFAQPPQTDPRTARSDVGYAHKHEIWASNYLYYDFACPFGTQVCTLHSNTHTRRPSRPAPSMS
jgi:hypothetical protein